MPITRLIERQPFGMLEFCGQVAVAFYSTCSYRGYAFLLLKTSDETLRSREGVTQVILYQ